MWKFKLKLFALHFLISAVIVIVSSVVVLYVWYPAPLYKASGVNSIYIIVLGIGLIVGPLLTLLVSKPQKKSLKFDLSVIIVLQLSAFTYGYYQVYDGRPVWIAHSVDRFDLVRNNEIDTRKLVEASPEYRKVSRSGPQYVAAIIPKDNSDLSNEILFDEIGSGIAPSQRPELYTTLNQVEQTMSERAQPLSVLDNYNDPAKVSDILSAYPQADSFLPLKTNAVNMIVLINTTEQVKVIKIVDLRPWE